MRRAQTGGWPHTGWADARPRRGVRRSRARAPRASRLVCEASMIMRESAMRPSRPHTSLCTNAGPSRSSTWPTDPPQARSQKSRSAETHGVRSRVLLTAWTSPIPVQCLRKARIRSGTPYLCQVGTRVGGFGSRDRSERSPDPAVRRLYCRPTGRSCAAIRCPSGAPEVLGLAARMCFVLGASIWARACSASQCTGQTCPAGTKLNLSTSVRASNMATRAVAGNKVGAAHSSAANLCRTGMAATRLLVRPWPVQRW